MKEEKGTATANIFNSLPLATYEVSCMIDNECPPAKRNGI